jgi:thiol:disulfide interchange protein
MLGGYCYSESITTERKGKGKRRKKEREKRKIREKKIGKSVLLDVMASWCLARGPLGCWRGWGRG